AALLGRVLIGRSSDACCLARRPARFRAIPEHTARPRLPAPPKNDILITEVDRAKASVTISAWTLGSLRARVQGRSKKSGRQGQQEGLVDEVLSQRASACLDACGLGARGSDA